MAFGAGFRSVRKGGKNTIQHCFLYLCVQSFTCESDIGREQKMTANLGSKAEPVLYQKGENHEREKKTEWSRQGQSLPCS